eukprot:5792785-Pleurochrysis_carterae.AAC.2
MHAFPERVCQACKRTITWTSACSHHNNRPLRQQGTAHTLRQKCMRKLRVGLTASRRRGANPQTRPRKGHNPRTRT